MEQDRYTHEGVRLLVIALLNNAVQDAKGRAVGNTGHRKSAYFITWQRDQAVRAIQWLRVYGPDMFSFAQIGVQPGKFNTWLEQQEDQWKNNPSISSSEPN